MRRAEMRQYLEASLGPHRFNLGLFGVFSFTAVLLAVSGLYGLVSYSVGQRRREIGLRMAIGATEWDVQRLILRQAAGLGIAGAVVGLCITGIARPFAARFAQDAVIDPAMAVAATTLLVAVVMVAAWLPARRAARIQPTVALKGEWGDSAPQAKSPAANLPVSGHSMGRRYVRGLGSIVHQ